jgi:hypothetical protein
VERSPRSVTVEVGPGRITLPAARIERIEEGSSALAEFHSRYREVAEGDLQGWLELGAWAHDAGLETQASEAYERARHLSPNDPRVNLGLGRVLQGGQWMTQEDAHRAQGLISFEGSWVTPAEKASIESSRQRQAEEGRQTRIAEMELRVREAEARAAEARAREAEALSSTPDPGGVPWPYAWGGTQLPVASTCSDGQVGCGPRHVEPRDHGREHPRPDPAPTPRPTTGGWVTPKQTGPAQGSSTTGPREVRPPK